MSFQNPTLLDVVNDILIDMGRDEINDLDATPEASRVLSILKDTYKQLLTRNLWEHKHLHKALNGAADTTKPTKLLIPEDVVDLKGVKYKVEENYYKELIHLYPEDFLRIVQNRNVDATEVVSHNNDEGVELRLYNDREPSYWTSFDEKNIYLDAWDSVADSTVVGGNTVAHVVVYPAFPTTASDTFDIPARVMPMYVAWSRSICFEKIKQMVSSSDQYWSRASYGRFLHDGSRTSQERPKKPTYGKRRR